MEKKMSETFHLEAVQACGDGRLRAARAQLGRAACRSVGARCRAAVTLLPPLMECVVPRPHSSSQHTRRLLVVPLSSPGSLIPLPPVGDGIKRPSLGRRVAHPRDTTELICTYTTCLEEGRVDTRGTGAMGKTCEAPWES